MSKADDAKALGEMIGAHRPDYAALAAPMMSSPSLLVPRYREALRAFELAVAAATSAPADVTSALDAARRVLPLETELGAVLYALREVRAAATGADVATINEGAARYQSANARWLAWINAGRAAIRAEGDEAMRKVSAQLARAETTVAAGKQAERAKRRGALARMRPEIQTAAAQAAYVIDHPSNVEIPRAMMKRARAVLADAERLLSLAPPPQPS